MWVFGYGSLLWNPGFRYSKKEIARLDGYRRSFSMRSIHRGTAENHGLVLALSIDRQSFCEGLAFKVEQSKEVETLDYLRGRGPNDEYLYSTRNKIAELGINDADIECLYTKVRLIKNQKDD